MKGKKRNGFWTLCFSFVPGCAEMYHGLMRMGVSLTIPFFAVAGVAWFLYVEELLLIDAVIWLYAFFHARNIAHMSEEELKELPDTPVNILDGLGGFEWSNSSGHSWNARLARGSGILLISFGIYKAMETVYHSLPFSDWLNAVFYSGLRMYPQLVIAVLAIVVGVRLIIGKGEVLTQEERKEEQADGTDKGSTED